MKIRWEMTVLQRFSFFPWNWGTREFLTGMVVTDSAKRFRRRWKIQNPLRNDRFTAFFIFSVKLSNIDLSKICQSCSAWPNGSNAIWILKISSQTKKLGFKPFEFSRQKLLLRFDTRGDSNSVQGWGVWIRSTPHTFYFLVFFILFYKIYVL